MEGIGAILSGSLALFSEALHDLGDSFFLGVALFLEKISFRGRTPQFSYGYRRFSLLGSLLAVVVLFSGSFLLIKESIERFFYPKMIDISYLLPIAIGGFLINSIAYFLTHKEDSMMGKVLSLHFLEDVLSWSSLLLLGGLLYFFPHLTWLDPLFSLGIALFVLVQAYRSLMRIGGIFLQKVPPSVDIEKLQEKIEALPQVEEVHDFHIWSLDGKYNISTLHVVVPRDSSLSCILKTKFQVREILKAFHIEHSTIEVEKEGEECELREC